MLKARSSIDRSISLQFLLIVPFVLQVFTGVGMVGYLSFRNGQKAVNDLADQLMDKSSQQVQEHLATYLALPIQLTQMNLKAIAAGDLDIRNQHISERYFWRQSSAFPNLAYVGYSLTDGTEAGAGRWVQNAGVLVYENRPGSNNTSDYATDVNGDRTARLQTYEYEPTTDDWYQDAIAARKLTWTRIYASENTPIETSAAGSSLEANQAADLRGELDYYVAVSASAPFYDKNRRLLGVTGIDLLLTKVSAFLRDLKVSQSGEVFILGRDGLLVASSTPEPIFYKEKDEIQRFAATNSPNLLIRSIAQQVQQSKPFTSIQSSEEFRVSFNDQRQYVQVTPWTDEYGLDWLVVVAIPESDFMAQIQANNRTTILLCLLALAAATLIGIMTSRWIIRPIQALNQATKSIAAGQINQQIAFSGIEELDAVGESFNRMAEQLQFSFDALEQNNSQLEDRVGDRTQELQQKNLQLQMTLEELHRTQAQMLQSEKMSALGQMVAGVAHEINNPISFVHGNLPHIERYTQDLLKLVEAYQNCTPNAPRSVQSLLEEVELEFVAEDLGKILQSMRMGTDRICNIILSLRNFSRLDESECKAVDLHEGIDNTLVILQHRLKPKADRPEIQVVRNYGILPLVECYAGQLNQVFMNILSNAIDALEESSRDRSFQDLSDRPNRISICTQRSAGDRVQVMISDNGAGISEAVRSRLFNPFFTTKPVGKGTGLGLSISYQIVAEKHHGNLWCESSDQGTTFVLEIPCRQPALV